MWIYPRLRIRENKRVLVIWVYISVAIIWLWAVDSVRPTLADWVGVGISLLGMAIIMFGSRSA